MPSDAVNARDPSEAAFAWSQRVLAITLWASCVLFGVYIAVFYFGATLGGDMTRWNVVLPDLYRPGEPGGSFAMAGHFAGGALVLVLGVSQLIRQVRHRWPRVHRLAGRLYVGGCLLAAIGGLAYILLVGTVGGPVMDVGFGIYGILMFVAALRTLQFARAGEFERHQRWAWRLFALAIASWLYRMEYGFWLALFGQAGHTATFDGPLDMAMAFFFYVPNLLIVELIYRMRQQSVQAPARFAASATLCLTALLVSFATYQFARRLWIPGILA